MIGSASMSARSPMALPEADLRPRMTPTTPVRPMPVTTSSQPNSRKLIGDDAGGAMDLVEQLRVLMEVMAPGGHFVGEGGDAVDDGHEGIRFLFVGWVSVA